VSHESETITIVATVVTVEIIAVVALLLRQLILTAMFLANHNPQNEAVRYFSIPLKIQCSCLPR
jgi:hypothetical protein